MEKIYHEVAVKDDSHTPGTPCVSVMAFKPDKDEEPALPAIIILRSGKVSELSSSFDYQTNIVTFWDHDGAKLIRRAIEEFDKFKEEVHTTADAEAKSG